MALASSGGRRVALLVLASLAAYPAAAIVQDGCACTLAPRRAPAVALLSARARLDAPRGAVRAAGERHILRATQPRASVRATASGDRGEEPILTPLFSKPALLFALVAYVVIVFLSDLLPGPNALTLDPATWKEAFALSTNFWLILPLTGRGPVLHPGLEAIFNFDLIWALMYAGFLVDGRAQTPNPLPFGRWLVAMQFLTAPVLLSYLAIREPAPQPIGAASLSPLEQVAESRALPAVLSALGVGVLAWGALARPEFGTDLATRTESLVALLSTDRLGSSFVVDLGVFAVCQGALVADDLTRRSAPPTAETRRLAAICTAVPFWGLAWYLANRPPLPAVTPAVAAASGAPAAKAAAAASPLSIWLPRGAPSAGRFDRSDPAAPVRAYFDAWNRRSMEEAAACTSEDVVYEDTLFPGKLVGRAALTAHLNKCADGLPDSFRFALDDVAASGELVGTRWHVELADGTPLPFARGASMYRVRNGLIVEGFDVPEPTLKTGSLSLAVLSVASRIGKALGRF